MVRKRKSVKSKKRTHKGGRSPNGKSKISKVKKLIKLAKLRNKKRR